MTDPDSFIPLISATVQAPSTVEMAPIILMVTAWLRATQDGALLDGRHFPGEPDQLLTAFNEFRRTQGLDENVLVDGDMLRALTEAALRLAPRGQLEGWGADIVLGADASEGPSLAPYVADLLIALGLLDKPKTLYLPFENAGQLASRAIKSGIDAWIESNTPSILRLGLINGGVQNGVIHACDPVLAPAALIANSTLKFEAGVAVLDLQTRYDTQILVQDIHRRFSCSAMHGPMAPIAHMLNQIEGRIVLLIPDYLLFSPGLERKLRQHLLAERQLEAVLSLPKAAVKGFKNTAAILILNSARQTENVLFIEASPELLLGAGDPQPKTHHVMRAVRDRRSSKFSSLVRVEDLLNSTDINLEPTRHVGKQTEPDHAVSAKFTTIDAHFELIRPRQHHFGSRGVPVQELQASDIPDYGLILSAGKPSQHDMDGAKAADYFLKENDIVICIKGAIGRVGCLSKTPPLGPGGWVCGQSIAVLRARNDGYAPQALMMYLRSPVGQNKLFRLAVGTSSPTIQAKALKAFQVPLLTLVQSDMAAEALEKEAAIENEILQLRRKQAQVGSFLWQQ